MKKKQDHMLLVFCILQILVGLFDFYLAGQNIAHGYGYLLIQTMGLLGLGSVMFYLAWFNWNRWKQ